MLRCAAAIVIGSLHVDSFAASCAPDKIDEEVRIAQVYDGDTVRLADGRRLRFIGIDSPEIGRDGELSQPFAQQALKNLRELLAGQQRLGLRFDVERRDRYHRRLAHLFLQNGVSVESWLLERGLATMLVVPPNTWNLECYAAAERRARGQRRGIWSLPRYQVIATEDLPVRTEGFHIIAGRVLTIDKTRNSTWIDLTGKLSLRIDREDLEYFSTGYFDQLQGRRIIARGSITPRARGPMMQIRHPAALEQLQ